MSFSEEINNASFKNIKPTKGLKDFMPENHAYFTYIKKIVRHRCRQSGYKRITTPFIEKKDIYKQTFGETHPIVMNSLYSCNTKEGEDNVLRPDLTPGILRSYLTNKLFEEVQPVELYSIEPVFKKDLIFKQSNIIDCEIIGEDGEALDTQLIFLAYKIFKDLGIDELVKLEINGVGSKEEMAEYKKQIQDTYYGKERSFCDNCKESLKSNPLLIFKCKVEDCKILHSLAPKPDVILSKESISRFEDLKKFLTDLDIKFTENHTLYGDRAFYDGFVFRFVYKTNDRSLTLCEGGRYNTLIEKLCGHKIPACGFSIKVERLITLMKREKLGVPNKDNLHIFVAQLSQDAKQKCLWLIEELRENGIKTVGALGKGSIREQLDLAARFKVPYTILIGLTEVRDKDLILRNMQRGTQENVSDDKIVDKLKEIFGEESLDLYKPGEIV